MRDEHTEYEVKPYDVKNDKTKTNFIVSSLLSTPFPHPPPPPSLKKQKQKYEIHLALLRMKKWKE